MHFSHPVFLFFAAFIAGTINSVAGGGSFVSFPALLFAGVAPIAANATNTAAVWPGTVASTVAYRKAFTPEARRLLLPLIVTGILGGIVGARILLITPQATFMRIVPWLLLGATLLFVFSGRITGWIRGRAQSAGRPGSRRKKYSARAICRRPLFGAARFDLRRIFRRGRGHSVSVNSRAAGDGRHSRDERHEDAAGQHR